MEKVTTSFPRTAEALAKEHGVSEKTIRNDGQFAEAVEALKPTVPDIEQRVMAGDVRRFHDTSRYGKLRRMPSGRLVCVAFAVFSMLLAREATAAPKDSQSPPVAVYIGPQVTDGMVETTAGIEASIRDLKRAARWRGKGLKVTDAADAASVSVIVLSRFEGGTTGGVAVPAGAGAVIIGKRERLINASIRAGEREYPLTCSARQWSACANQLIDDLIVWIQANRALLPPAVQ